MENTIIKLNGNSIDLAPALPLLLEDWFALEKLNVTMETLAHASLSTMYELAKYVIKKADPTADVTGVLKMTMSELREIFTIVGNAEAAGLTNRPSTTSSTS
jgi:hypothetical protein